MTETDTQFKLDQILEIVNSIQNASALARLRATQAEISDGVADVAETVPALQTGDSAALTISADRYYTAVGAAGSSGFLPSWMAGAAGTITYGNWDATDKRAYITLESVIGTAISANTAPKFIHYLGPFGTTTSYSPKNVAVTSVTIQCRARFNGAVDFADVGLGCRSGTGVTFVAADHVIQVLRNSGSWELGTSDGATFSQTTGGTADSNFHNFKVIWNATNVRLYVDDVLTVTKTTNMPAQPMNPILANKNGLPTIDVVDYYVTWEA